MLAWQVGIAGRTGCGKSTLMMALWRIVEASSGRIAIDGIDTASIGLTDLRTRLALVPQACPHPSPPPPSSPVPPNKNCSNPASCHYKHHFC